MSRARAFAPSTPVEEKAAPPRRLAARTAVRRAGTESDAVELTNATTHMILLAPTSKRLLALPPLLATIFVAPALTRNSLRHYAAMGSATSSSANLPRAQSESQWRAQLSPEQVSTASRHLYDIL